MFALHQLQLEVAAPQQLLGGNLAALAPEHRIWMADTEGLQPLQLAQEIAVNLAQAQQGFRFHRGAPAALLQPALGESLQFGVQGRHLVSPHREPPRCGMAAKALQQGRTVLQGLVHRKAARGPHRGPQATIALPGQQGGGQAKTLHQPGGDNADHPVVPMVLGQQQEGRPAWTIGLQQGQGLGLNGAAELASLPVQGFTLAGQGQGPIRILRGEELHHQLGIAQPAHGIDARGDLEAHRLGVQGAIVETRQLLESLQADQGAAPQFG